MPILQKGERCGPLSLFRAMCTTPRSTQSSWFHFQPRTGDPPLAGAGRHLCRQGKFRRGARPAPSEQTPPARNARLGRHHATRITRREPADLFGVARPRAAQAAIVACRLVSAADANTVRFIPAATLVRPTEARPPPRDAERVCSRHQSCALGIPLPGWSL